MKRAPAAGDSASTFETAPQRHGFAFIPPETIADKELTCKALGILVYCLSRPPGWVYYAREISSHFKDGPDSIATGLRKLVELGYILRERRRDEHGKFLGFRYTVYSTPQAAREAADAEEPKASLARHAPAGEPSTNGKSRYGSQAPTTGKPIRGKPSAGESALVKTHDMHEKQQHACTADCRTSNRSALPRGAAAACGVKRSRTEPAGRPEAAKESACADARASPKEAAASAPAAPSHAAERIATLFPSLKAIAAQLVAPYGADWVEAWIARAEQLAAKERVPLADKAGLIRHGLQSGAMPPVEILERRQRAARDALRMERTLARLHAEEQEETTEAPADWRAHFPELSHRAGPRAAQEAPA